MEFSEQEIIAFVKQKIQSGHDKDELELISKYFVQDVYGNKSIYHFNTSQWTNFDRLVNKLATGCPLQYVTNKAYFLNTVFYVDERVLIPRPETEELVLKICKIIDGQNINSILEVGVGSGCMAIEIKKRCPNVSVIGIDNSVGALEVAKINVVANDLDIDLIHFDFLDERRWQALPRVDMVVSNPPYISNIEQIDMKSNVIDFEPHEALFSGDHPDIFYSKIIGFAKLQGIYSVACELNEFRSDQIAKLFRGDNWSFKLYNDLQNKPRYLLAKK